MKKRLNIVIVCARNYFPLDGGDKHVSLGLLKILSRDNNVTVFNVMDEEYSIEFTRTALLEFCKNVHCIRDSFLSVPLSIIISYLTATPFYKVRRNNRNSIRKQLQQVIVKDKPHLIIWDHLRATSYFSNNDSTNILLEHNNEVKIYKEKVKRYPKIAQLFLSFQVYLLRKNAHGVYRKMQKVVNLSAEDIESPTAKQFSLNYIMPEFPQKDYVVKNNFSINLLFVGRLDWYANIEGIVWFIRNVMPDLPPRFNLIIVGKNPDQEVIKLTKEMARVKLYANVESVEPFFEDADIFISPVFKGSGINIKVLEAASHAMPMVLSSFSKKGYDGLDFVDNGDTKTEFIANLIKQAEEPAKRKCLSKKIREWYIKYSQEKTAHIQKIFLEDK